MKSTVKQQSSNHSLTMRRRLIEASDEFADWCVAHREAVLATISNADASKEWRRVRDAEYLLCVRFNLRMNFDRGAVWYDSAVVDDPEYPAALEDPEVWQRLMVKYWRFSAREPVEIRFSPGGPLPPIELSLFGDGHPPKLSRWENWQRPHLTFCVDLEQVNVGRGRGSNRAAFLQKVNEAADQAWGQREQWQLKSPYAPLWELLQGTYGPFPLDWLHTYLYDDKTYKEIAAAAGVKDEDTVSEWVNRASEVRYGVSAEDRRHILKLKAESDRFDCQTHGSEVCPEECSYRQKYLRRVGDDSGRGKDSVPFHKIEDRVAPNLPTMPTPAADPQKGRTLTPLRIADFGSRPACLPWPSRCS